MKQTTRIDAQRLDRFGQIDLGKGNSARGRVLPDFGYSAGAAQAVENSFEIIGHFASPVTERSAGF